MKKESYLALMIITVVILTVASYATYSGLKPGWLPVIVIVMTFPVWVLSLFLWWNASNIEGDFPFTGY